MSGWSKAARQGGWAYPSGEDMRPRRRHRGWTPAEVAVLVAAFVIRWELGLAFLALKLWHQSSGYEGGVFAFARAKWEELVAFTSGMAGRSSLPFSFHHGARSSGNLAFDAWRQSELERIEAEREKLRVAEHDFAAYRDELLRARDREAFERFMQGRSV
jgi:hypothetical protein